MPKRLLLCFVLYLCLIQGGAGAPAWALDDPASHTTITVLDNGLTVLALEDHSTPVAVFQMWVRAGSRDESRYTGIAHLFEHMMFKGSKHVGPEEHAQRIQAHGGSLNAYTTQEVTVYYEDVPSEALPLVIDLEFERVANLDINQQTLDSERQVVLEERRMRTEDSPEGRLFETLLATRFIAHPYRWPVIGWASDVEKVTLEACQTFFHHYYVPNNLVLVIVGDFDTAQTLKQVRKTFGKLEPSYPVPRNPTVEPPQDGERRADIFFDVESPILAVAWHAPPTGHPDGPVLDLMGELLSNGRSSRLYRRLVYEGKQALSASGGYWELKDDGLFYAFVGARPEASIEDLEKQVYEEVGRLRDEPLSEDELEKAKRQMEVALVNAGLTNHATASRIGGDYVDLGRIRPFEEILAEIQRVTPADVQRVARATFVDTERTVVRILPKQKREAVEGGNGK